MVVLALEGEKAKIEISRAGASDWDPAYVGQQLRPGDRGRTGPSSRLTLRLSDLSVMRVAERSEFTIKEPPKPDETHGISLWQGLVYLFHRDKPGSTHIDSRTSTAATRGTEFSVEVDAATGAMTLTVLAGAGELANGSGTLLLHPGEAGRSEAGSPPHRTPKIDARQAIQWVLYYPGILSTEDLDWGAVDPTPLRESLAAYEAGDLAGAFRAYPPGRLPGTEPDRVYRAALLISIGQIGAGSGLLEKAPGPGLSGALTRLVDTVRGTGSAGPLPAGGTANRTATEWMSESYRLQSALQLQAALEAARQATVLRPRFGFAWVRVAELEFGFGHRARAEEAVTRALELSPKNAQAWAMKGFLAAGASREKPARDAFEHAIALDGGLANAWLGRGLMRLRAGDLEGGREDLQVAASLEPQRGILRSYLAKAWQQAGDLPRATHELELARELDPGDPTAWLYSALLNQQHNRFNQAIRDLEESTARNDNRALYRSRLLLDQDRAVRGANLAGAYQDAGLGELGLAEAARAISSDYGNYSAHLFLANSYNQLRDPHQVNLRYETPWLSEYLVANLLAPAAAGTVSQSLSQQEYSRFFERDGFGIVSQTEYLSRGDWLESAAQYGRFAHMSYAVETSYRSERGQRPNEDLESRFVDVQIKQELTAADSIYLQAIYYDANAGDLTPYYDPAQASASSRLHETQQPILLAGYHHEWAPGVHTLFLGGRLSDDLSYRNPASPNLLFVTGGGGSPVAFPVTTDQTYRSQIEIYTAELQQILQSGEHTWVFGIRGQSGEFNAHNTFNGDVAVPGFISVPVDPVSEVGADFSRISAYLYDHWQVAPSLLLVAGLGYDRVRHPLNHRFAPLVAGEETIDQLSPKLGLVWTPGERTTVRGGVSRSLGGASFDQSFQLEPSQVAGFNQAFRSLIPESVANANSGAEFRMGGISVEQRLTSNTWAGVTAEWLASDLERTVGTLEFGIPIAAASARQKLDYEERSLSAHLFQLLGQEWSLGVRYRLSQAALDQPFLDLPASAFPSPPFGSSSVTALQHQARMFVQFQHPGGFFALAEGLWQQQHNRGYLPDLPGDDFWQFNLHAGYRLPNRRAELRVGLLNLADQDYRLNPLNLTEVLPRTRTLAVSLKLNF